MVVIHFLKLEPAQVHVFQAGRTLFSGLLDDAPRYKSKTGATVLLPSQHLVLTQVRVPSKNRQKIAQAVPYLLEDSVLEPLEQLHFAIGAQQRDNRVPVAVVNAALLTHIQQRLHTMGYKILHIFPDVLALPWQKNSWTLLRLNDFALVRTDKNHGFVSEVANINLLNLMYFEQLGKPQKIQLINADKLSKVLDLPRETSCETQTIQSTIYSFELGLKTPPELDLMPTHAQAIDWRALWPRLRISVALVMVWLLLAFGEKIYRIQQLKQQKNQLQQQVEGILRQTFPDIRRVVNPRIQMEQQLAQLRQHDVLDTGFLAYLQQIQTFITPSQMQLKQLSYQNRQLELQALLPSLQQLEQLKQQISATGLQVTIQSVNSENQVFEVRLRISRLNGL